MEFLKRFDSSSTPPSSITGSVGVKTPSGTGESKEVRGPITSGSAVIPEKKSSSQVEQALKQSDSTNSRLVDAILQLESILEPVLREEGDDPRKETGDEAPQVKLANLISFQTGVVSDSIIRIASIVERLEV